MKSFSCLLLGLCAGLFINDSAAFQDLKAEPKAQELVAWKEIEAAMRKSGKPWHTVMDRPSLSTGIYRLPAGGSDGQSPHAYDEIYYIIRGQATLSAGDEELPMQAGSIAYVARDVPHHFHDIEADLEVLVFFSKYAPPK